MGEQQLLAQASVMMKLPYGASDKYREDGHPEQEVISLWEIGGSSGRISKYKCPKVKVKDKLRCTFQKQVLQSSIFFFWKSQFVPCSTFSF